MSDDAPVKREWHIPDIIPADNNQNPVTALGGGDNVIIAADCFEMNSALNEYVYMCLVFEDSIQVKIWAVDSRLQVWSKKKTGELKRSQPCFWIKYLTTRNTLKWVYFAFSWRTKLK